jgi:hypothetical protein
MQMGMLMMATQNPNGIGSGQLSGVRGPRPRPRAQSADPAQGRRRNPGGPGGLAGGYFNRAAIRTGVPRNYYGRQTRYFP